MKKKVFASFLLAGMVLGTGQAVFAAQHVSPTGYEVIDNGDGSQYDPAEGADITVNGTLGPIDNGNENENLPEGDSRWIKVELPTEVVFNTVGDNNETIESTEYNVTNLSGRPVKVSLGNFIADSNNKEGAVETLNLTAGGKSINLLTLPEDRTLATLQVPSKGGNIYSFNYTGTTNPDKLVSDERIEVGYTMNLKFEVLKADGNPAK
ncbi:MAG: hypothetical protein ACTIDE_17080 [Carnobacterium maltaromaticum]